MQHKTFIRVYILAIILFGNIENSHAQFFKKLKGKASKVVIETVDKISSTENKKKDPQKSNSKKGNKEDNQGTTNNNKSKALSSVKSAGLKNMLDNL